MQHHSRVDLEPSRASSLNPRGCNVIHSGEDFFGETEISNVLQSREESIDDTSNTIQVSSQNPPKNPDEGNEDDHQQLTTINLSNGIYHNDRQNEIIEEYHHESSNFLSSSNSESEIECSEIELDDSFCKFDLQMILDSSNEELERLKYDIGL